MNKIAPADASHALEYLSYSDNLIVEYYKADGTVTANGNANYLKWIWKTGDWSKGSRAYSDKNFVAIRN